mmetsp:Transcript_25300/g.45579  ORF Transcript_25300/g.45579 Transcript_25300/m.45579 type:complete len:265 (+) Transcript_25300:501-1295(+)
MLPMMDDLLLLLEVYPSWFVPMVAKAGWSLLSTTIPGETEVTFAPRMGVTVKEGESTVIPEETDVIFAPRRGITVKEGESTVTPEETDVIFAPRTEVTVKEGDEGLDATAAEPPFISPYACPFAILTCISFRYRLCSLPTLFVGTSPTNTTAPLLLLTFRTSIDRLRKIRCCSSSNLEKTDKRRLAMCVSSVEWGMEARMETCGFVVVVLLSPLVRTKNVPGRGGMAGSFSWTTSPNNPMEVVPGGGGEFVVDPLYCVTSTLSC